MMRQFILFALVIDSVKTEPDYDVKPYLFILKLDSFIEKDSYFPFRKEI